MALPSGLTPDGYEVQFSTYYLGHTLPVKLLLPTLLSTAFLPASDVRKCSSHRLLSRVIQMEVYYVTP